MANSGRHVKKNPSVSNKVILTSAALSILLTSAGLANYHKNENKENTNNDNVEYYTENESISLYDLINSVESKYSIYQNDKDLNTTGLIFEYIKEQINDSNLTDEERKELLNNLFNDENLENNIYNYIRSKNYDVITIQTNDIDKNEVMEKINIVYNNSEVMAKIKEYSVKYQIPESILVGIIASHASYDKSLQSSIIESYSKDWFTNNIQNTVITYDGNGNAIGSENLGDWRNDDTIMRLAAAFAKSIMNENEDMIKAIQSVELGPNGLMNIQNEDILNKYKKQAEFILYAAKLYNGNDERTIIHFASNRSVSGPKDKEIIIESNTYQEYLNSILTSIINELDATIIQNKSR